jgi:hypothetical protein
VVAAISKPAHAVACFRVCDQRFPFLWASSAQPAARWHDDGEGPCHYLGSAPKVAWAEVVRHEEIRDVDDLDDLDCAIWLVGVVPPVVVPVLAHAVLTGDRTTYPACRAEAQRLRAAGHRGLTSPSAAVVSEQAESFGVDAAGQYVTGTSPAEVVVIWEDTPPLEGAPVGHGTADSSVLADVRHF